MMAIGSVALTLLLAGTSALVVRDEPAKDPWWQRATIQPRSLVVQGVPVKRLHPDWCAAEAFSRAAMKLPIKTKVVARLGDTSHLGAV